MPETITQVGTNLTTLKNALVEFTVRYGLQILGALLILIVGATIASHTARVLEGWLTKKTTVDIALRGLMVKGVRLVLLGVTLVVAAEKVGVPVASLIAGLGVAGIGIGLAVQGVLSNLIAGMTIFFLKPFKVGEFIDILNEHGEVVDISLFSTTLRHTDLSLIVIPNRKIVGEILHNYGLQRQLDLKVSIRHDADIGMAIHVAREAVVASPRVLKDPAPLVGVRELSESAMTISIRPWVSVAEYEQACLDLYRAIVEAYRAKGLSIALPQREIRIVNAEAIGGAAARPALEASPIKVN
jgi:small conductance mechanosensitive channel